MPTRPWTENLACVRCYSATHLTRIAPVEQGVRLLTYECNVCGHFNLVHAVPPLGGQKLAA